MALHHGHLVVNVHDEPRQLVPFPVHPPEAIRPGVVEQAEQASFGEGLLEAFEVKCQIDGAVFVGEDAHGDAAGLVVPHGADASFGVGYAHQVAVGGASFHPGDGAGKHPGVMALEGFFASGVEPQYGKGFHGQSREVLMAEKGAQGTQKGLSGP